MLSAVLSLGGQSQAQVIYKNKAYQVKGNSVIQGKFAGKALDAKTVVSNY